MSLVSLIYRKKKNNVPATYKRAVSPPRYAPLCNQLAMLRYTYKYTSKIYHNWINSPSMTHWSLNDIQLHYEELYKSQWIMYATMRIQNLDSYHYT